MHRKLVVAALLTLVLVGPVRASDDDCPAELQAPPSPYGDLDVLFPMPAEEVIETSSCVILRTPSPEVLVARVGIDGKIVVTCVDSAEAARHFFESPFDRLPAKTAAEK